jgi:hypothetical protein
MLRARLSPIKLELILVSNRSKVTVVGFNGELGTFLPSKLKIAITPPLTIFRIMQRARLFLGRVKYEFEVLLMVLAYFFVLGEEKAKRVDEPK